MSKLVRISETDDWIVDYDKERGMYRVSYFEDMHFVDECWFDAYEDKEVDEIKFVKAHPFFPDCPKPEVVNIGIFK